jgi:hypothetical protein
MLNRLPYYYNFVFGSCFPFSAMYMNLYMALYGILYRRKLGASLGKTVDKLRKV